MHEDKKKEGTGVKPVPSYISDKEHIVRNAEYQMQRPYFRGIQVALAGFDFGKAAASDITAGGLQFGS